MNPLLDFYNAAMALPATTTQLRADAIRKYGFAIPTDDALEHIERYSPGGVVEIGAGSGYWAHLLDRRGVNVRAFDIEPAPSSANKWFAGTQPWHRVEIADHRRRAVPEPDVADRLADEERHLGFSGA